MTSDDKPYQATPAQTLRDHIMDSRIPKNEAEHWAANHIEKIEQENSQLFAMIKQAEKADEENRLILSRALVAVQREREELKKRVVALLDALKEAKRKAEEPDIFGRVSLIKGIAVAIAQAEKEL